MSDSPVLTTARFGLWRPVAADLPQLCALIDDEETRRYLGPASPDPQAQFDRLMRNAGSWALHGYGTFMVRPHGESGIVATCGVFHSWRGFGPDFGMDDVAEAGWIVHRDWWGKGLAREAMETVLAWFDRAHGPRRIACMIEDGNVASQRLAQALGFTAYAERRDEADGTLLHLLERGSQAAP
ncbi:GNAT family N-acetyltransferase [Novosphingobium resinovorum]|uniref:GNAT family N-acetyltransferase n=1 Tax=Novosphingobium resinovorum TaxID=158500 RepID=UPI002ED02FC5|nr:GNAT family N-acetyltransferase [Novosphingobium resinovorum]